MKTIRVFLRILIICIMFNFITSCKNGEEKVQPREEENFFLQMTFGPSFVRGCNIEITSINKIASIKISPEHWQSDDHFEFLIFPPFIHNISDDDYSEFRDLIKDIDLKSMKSDEGIPVDGMSVKGIYSDLSQYHNFFYFSDYFKASDNTLLAKAVLELCIKYVPYEPTLKVLEDVYGYIDDSFSIRKVRDYDNYYRFSKGNERKDSARDFSDFFTKLPKNKRVIFDLSNIEFVPNSFRENFHKYAKSNDKIIFLFQDYEKYYCGEEPVRNKRFVGKSLAEMHLRKGNFFFDNLKLLKFIDPEFKNRYPDSLIINKNCDEQNIRIQYSE